MVDNVDWAFEQLKFGNKVREIHWPHKEDFIYSDGNNIYNSKGEIWGLISSCVLHPITLNNFVKCIRQMNMPEPDLWEIVTT